MKRFYRLISLPLEILLILSSLIGGWKLIEPHTGAVQYSIHTSLLIVLFIISILLHCLIQKAGTLAGGLLSGRKLIAYRFGKKNYVREKDKFYSRELLPEQEIISSIMTKEKNESVLSWILYLYGDVLCDFLLTLGCWSILIKQNTFSSSGIYVFLLTFYFSGIITTIISLIPLYRADIPNNALLLVQMILSPECRTDAQKTFDILRILSEESLPEDFTLPDIDEQSFSSFKGYYLYHLYEIAIWYGNIEKADLYISLLYQHRHDLPEGFQDLIQKEAICFLAVKGTEEDLSAIDLYFDEQRRMRLEGSSGADAKRCLYLWSSHQDDMKDQSEIYYQQSIKQINNVPFRQARERWMGTIIHG